MIETEFPDFLFLLIIIFILTLVQSLFGVGLLVFGTPTLLILGYPFFEVLSFLLPSSIVVSFLQVHRNWEQINLYKLSVIKFILPMVLLGLYFTIFYIKFNFNLAVGLLLLFISLTRYSDKLNNSLRKYFRSRLKLGFLLTGIIHGFTNLGGALLVIITNGIYKDKSRVQPNIAYAYMFMASIQLSLLFVTGNYIFSTGVFVYPLISGITFFLMGSHIFEKVSSRVYESLMTFLIFFYGLLLIFK